ncbi:MAG: hypothetical protein P4L84_27155 [Isosphaeraceae bacterium]|nr:hypothetical protein [Isosphaeraceae bacterium]
MHRLGGDPVQAWDDPEASLREEYVGCFRDLKRLIHEASDSGMGILVSLGSGEQEYEGPTDQRFYGRLEPSVRRWAVRFFGSVMGCVTLLVLGVRYWGYRRMPSWGSGLGYAVLESCKSRPHS